MTHFTCPKCQQTQERPDNSAGQVVRCDCGQQLRVPALSPAKSAPARKPAPRDEPIDVLEEVEEPLDVLPVNEKRRRRDSDEPDDFEDEDREEKRSPRRKRRGELPDDLPAEVDRLGEMRTIHESSKVGPIIGIVFFSFFILGGLFSIPLCFLVRNPAPLVLGFFGLLLGSLGILWASWNMGLKVILFEGGFVQAKRGRYVVVPWEEIELVWQAITEHYTNGVHTGTTYLYSVQLYDGTFLRLNTTLKGIQHLGKEIMHHTSQVLHPKLMARYDKGKVADFGDLGISKEGLHYGSSLLEWEEIDAVQIQRGYIGVSKRGKWFNWCNIAASNVPNLWVFLSMVDQIIGIKH